MITWLSRHISFVVQFCLLAGQTLAVQESNLLAPEEKSAGWRLLFDGASFAGWRSPGRQNVIERVWRIEDGCLRVDPNWMWGGDLISIDQYLDFELTLEFRLDPDGNSGIKYLVREEWTDPTRLEVQGWATRLFIFSTVLTGALILAARRRAGALRGLTRLVLAVSLCVLVTSISMLFFLGGRGSTSVGLEFQLIDRPPATPSATETSGALYGMLAPFRDPDLHRGDFNEARVRVISGHVEHWLNGIKVLQYELGTDRFSELLESSKFAGTPGFGLRRAGHIALQNHMDGVCFRNVKIRTFYTGN